MPNSTGTATAGDGPCGASAGTSATWPRTCSATTCSPGTGATSSFPGPSPHWHELYYLGAIRTQRLDENQWWEIDAILGKLDEALELVRGILGRHTVASVREPTISQGARSYYDKISDQYPGTLLDDPNRPGQLRITLEGNFRLSEAEMVTHLYNVHRLKRAQGLQARVTLPRVGFWLLPDWDRSEA